jgi:hypothetical protein
MYGRQTDRRAHTHTQADMRRRRFYQTQCAYTHKRHDGERTTGSRHCCSRHSLVAACRPPTEHPRLKQNQTSRPSRASSRRWPMLGLLGRDGGVLTSGDVDNIRNMLFDADAGAPSDPPGLRARPTEPRQGRTPARLTEKAGHGGGLRSARVTVLAGGCSGISFPFRARTHPRTPARVRLPALRPPTAHAGPAHGGPTDNCIPRLSWHGDGKRGEGDGNERAAWSASTARGSRVSVSASAARIHTYVRTRGEQGPSLLLYRHFILL